MGQIVSNCLNTDKSIIGREFSGGPFFLVLAVVLSPAYILTILPRFTVGAP